MAHIIYVGNQHDCYRELQQELAPASTVPIGTVAECSCGKRYIISENQFDGRDWAWRSDPIK